jgi:hypothetical protein
MDAHRATRNRHPPVAPSSWPFLLALETRSDKELAEDWIQDKDGILVFVRLISHLLYGAVLNESFFFSPSLDFSPSLYPYLSSGVTPRCCVVPLW